MTRRVLASLMGRALAAAAGMWSVQRLDAQGPAELPPAPPAAQTEEIPEGPIIRSEVTEVIVPVTVKDTEGRFVSNLTVDDFTLYDQGVRQNIKFFSSEKAQPVVIGFLMELSSSMRLNWKTFKENAVEMVLTLLTGDKRYQGYLVGFGTEAELLVDTTYDPEKIVAKLDKISAGGGAALFDALYMSMNNRTLVKGEPLEPHRVIIVFGDGKDTSMKHSLDEVIEMAQRNFVSIYAISSDRYGFTSPSGKNLKRLAEETGGRVEYPLENTYDNTAGFMSNPANDGNRRFADGTGGYTNVILKSLYNSIRAIQGEITTQYILRYQPNTPGYEGAEHRLDVRVNSLPNVTVTARPKYYRNVTN